MSEITGTWTAAQHNALLRESLERHFWLYRDESLAIDRRELRVWLHDREVNLSARELRLLFVLAAAPRTVFARWMLTGRIGTTLQGLYVAICRLRRKLGQEYIISQSGGYSLTRPAPPQVRET